MDDDFDNASEKRSGLPSALATAGIIAATAALLMSGGFVAAMVTVGIACLAGGMIADSMVRWCSTMRSERQESRGQEPAEIKAVPLPLCHTPPPEHYWVATVEATRQATRQR